MSKKSSRDSGEGGEPVPAGDERDSLDKLADFARRILLVPKAEVAGVKGSPPELRTPGREP